MCTGMDMVMQMTFYVSTKVTVLFESWETKSVGGIIGTCLVWAVIAVLYEGLKWFRGFIHKRYSCWDGALAELLNGIAIGKDLGLQANCLRSAPTVYSR